ncbi:hypothetical protein IWZ00DRAFT_31529 [Phyllosticta capitalensis]
MSPPRTLLRLRRTDVDAQDQDDFVLVSVQAIGPQPLDLKLIGTESENVYATSIRHKKIKDLQLRPAYKGSDAEWEAILKHVLLKSDEPSHGPTGLDDIEIISAVSDGRINLTLRKNIAGVTQRIGAIRLPEDNDTEISLFHWAGDAVLREDAERREKKAAQATVVTKENECRKYKGQCENFTKVKPNHETAILAKTTTMMNAKKLKIRDLQRLLACAKVDPAAAAAVEGARKSTRGRRAGPSRPNKRAASDSESDEDSSFESRKPKPKPAQDEDDDETDDADVTPDNSDQDETEDEQDGDMGDVASVPGAAKPGEGAKKKAIETVAGNGNSPEQRKPDSPPPPRRELPFTRKNGQSLSGQQQQQQQQSGKAPAADDEDDTTEDEL